MKKIKKSTFRFLEFSKKQRKVLNWWCASSPVKDYDGIIADGAIRSGKTLCMSLSFVIWALESFNGQNLGMCGKTIGSFRRNVLVLLKLMLVSRGYGVSDLRADNLVVVTKGSRVKFDGNRHVINSLDGLLDGKYYVSCDYGTQNPTVFLLWCQDKTGRWVCLREYYYSGRDENSQKTDTEYADNLETWLGSIKPVKIVIDPSAASFIAELKKRGYNIKKAKNDVLDGIRYVASLLSLGKIAIYKECTNTLKEFASYIWDAKAAERGEDKPVKQWDHCMDGIRYFLYTIVRKPYGIHILK